MLVRSIGRVLLAAAALVAAATIAAANAYPDHVVRIINPYPPGGSVDVMRALRASRAPIRNDAA